MPDAQPASMDSDLSRIFWTRDFFAAAASGRATVLLCDVDDPRLRALSELSPTEADLRQADRYSLEACRYFFARRALLRHLIAQRLGRPVSEIIIAPDASGAPRILSPADSTLRLSSSRRGSLAALALATHPIGADIEIAKGSEIPDAVLHPIEASRLADLDPPTRAARCLSLWTLKEAYVKALGVGFAREPRDIAIEIEIETDQIRISDRGRPVVTRAAEIRSDSFGSQDVVAACVVL